jgi:putative cell wall-binding protein
MRKALVTAVVLGGMLVPSAVAAAEEAPATSIQVIVVGGRSVISEGVVAHLQICSDDQTTRIAGSNRYSTAGKIADLGNASGGTVYVASGERFPDASAAGAAANARGWALVLVSGSSVPAPSLAALDRIAPDRLIIAGGTAAVGAGVEAVLRDRYGTVSRVAGPNRYATAVAISRGAFPTGSDAVIIATGEGFVDALTSTPLAAHLNAPVLLTQRSILPVSVVGELDRLDPREVLIVGGTAVLDDAVEDAIRAAVPDATVTRLAGSNRFDTARKIADRLPPNPVRVLAVTSTNFPDALAAGAVSGTGPLVLIDGAGLNSVSAAMIGSATGLPCNPMVRLSSFTTYHKPGQSRVVNIHLIADQVDGAVVGPGATFSLNGHVGERTTEKGYVAAGAIIGGVLVCCDHPVNIGGGTSQFATTLFNAGFHAALEDVYHRPHSIYFNRYPLGVEATLGWTSPDVKFRNDTDWPVQIDTSYTSTSITVDIWGWHGGRKVSHTVSGSATTSGGGEVDIVRVRTFPDGSVHTDTWHHKYNPLKENDEDDPDPPPSYPDPGPDPLGPNPL